MKVDFAVIYYIYHNKLSYVDIKTSNRHFSFFSAMGSVCFFRGESAPSFYRFIYLK